MENKLLFGVLVLLLLVTTVTAHSFSEKLINLEVISQQKIDNLNISNIDLNFRWIDSFQDLKINCNGVNLCSRDWYLETVLFYNNTFYRLNKTGDIKFNTNKYYQISEKYNNSYAKKLLIEYFDKKEIKLINWEKRKLKNLQSQSVYNIDDVFDSEVIL